MKKYSDKIPLKKMAKQEDKVEASIHLLSDASIYISCTDLKVDEHWSKI